MSLSIRTIVILAAGRGTRMKSELPKVLHEVCGRPLLSYVLAAATPLGAERLAVVVGPGQDQALLPDGTAVAVQEEQLGTGHALLAAAALILEGPMLVLPGDTPLLTHEVLQELVRRHEKTQAEATVLSMRLTDPTGYGRLLRDEDGWVTKIIEHRDASPKELEVSEVNAGVYVLPSQRTLEVLARVGRDNDQGEVYLTDVVAGLCREGARVAAWEVDDPTVAFGVNSRVELARAQEIMRGHILRQWMLSGVTVEDPASTHIDADVVVEPDTRVLPFTCLRGCTQIGRGSEIGPATTLIDTVVGLGCTIRYSYCQGAVVEAGAAVGPFSYLRPEAHLMEGAKAGAFVEIKKSTIGPGSKVPHLSYIGDSAIGAGTNIGAGNITANYDGYRKHKTVIGNNVKTGSDTVFVAPVTIGDDVTIGAGSVITRDVPDGALGIARIRQRNIQGYSKRQRGREREEDDG